MLITNGKTTRNIDAKKLPEYKAKGYTEVNIPEKPKTPEKGKK